MRGRILVKNQGGQKHKISVRYLVVMVGLLIWTLVGVWYRQKVDAARCPDVRIVYARGSGGERWTTDDYLAFKEAIEQKLATTELTYEFMDLDYAAVGIADIAVLAGAYFGAGEAYEFGESVTGGVKKLVAMVNSEPCANTKYVVGGYSQGAMVASRALADLDANRIIYVATFGDPKIYLPEGEGLMPAACRGENLSDYRMYVPDCQAYKGMLGANMPYEPLALTGKVGTWCNKRDIFCSSKHWDLVTGISDHVAYVADNLYEDASRVIFDKICQTYGIKNTVSSPHDTVILIDSTGSMTSMIEKYKAEARRLAQETLNSGGRVALYDYRDYKEGYTPVKHCDFTDCTMEAFEAGLAEIHTYAGGDTPESLMASSLHIMQELDWRLGATKSIVVLTDAGYHDPDYDIGGTTQLDVVRLSKRIDPVNFYIITNPANEAAYTEFATATGGMVITNFDELSLLTDYILERYDSLPRVEEMDVEPVTNLPTLTVNSVKLDSKSGESVATVDFTTNGTHVIVALNDAALGITNVEDGRGTISITGLDWSLENTIKLVPINESARGETVETRLNGRGGGDNPNGSDGGDIKRIPAETTAIIPKAPNSGRR